MKLTTDYHYVFWNINHTLICLQFMIHGSILDYQVYVVGVLYACYTII